MAPFSVSDAAISGFRFIRSQPRVMLVWTGAFVVFELVWGGLLVVLAGDNIAKFEHFRELINTDILAALAMLPAVALVLLFGMIGRLAFWSVMFAAAYRAMLSPDYRAPGFIHFGTDEIRMAGLISLWSVLVVGYGFLVLFAFLLLSVMGAALPGLIKMLYLLIVAVGCASAVVWPTVRLSMSMPMTLHGHHIRLFDSWKLTRGRFWPLFGAYLITAILMAILVILAAIVIGVVAAAVTLATGGSINGLSGVLSADPNTLSARFSLASLISALIEAPIWAASLAVFVGPVATAYQALTEPAGQA